MNEEFAAAGLPGLAFFSGEETVGIRTNGIAGTNAFFEVRVPF